MKKTKGVTLIELTIVIVLVGILAVALGGFIVQAVNAWQFVDTRNEISNAAKKALDWMVRDIREIKDKYSINTADTSHLDFYNTQSPQETIDIRLAGTTIYRSTDGGTTRFPLCDNVQNLTFTYFDDNGNQLSTPVSDTTLIRKIKIELTVEKKNRQIYFESFVIPRNLYE